MEVVVSIETILLVGSPFKISVTQLLFHFSDWLLVFEAAIFVIFLLNIWKPTKPPLSFQHMANSTYFIVLNMLRLTFQLQLG